jgi:hypothetical protein
MLHELGDLAERIDPVPASVLEAARAAMCWRRVDTELAELVAEAQGDEARQGPPWRHPCG